MGCQFTERLLFQVIITMDRKLALINFIDIVLRVPSLFILDEAFQSSLADLGLYPSSLLPLHKEADFDFVTGGNNHTLLKPHHSVENYDPTVFGNFSQSHKDVIEFGISITAQSYFDNVIHSLFLGHLIQIVLLTLSTAFSLFTLTLWTKHLVRFYEYMFSILLIAFSYHCNSQTYRLLPVSLITIFSVTLNLNLDGIFQVIPGICYVLCNIAIQLILACSYLFVNLRPSLPFVRELITLSFLVPSLAVAFPFRHELVPFGSIIVPCLHIVGLSLYHLPKVRLWLPHFLHEIKWNMSIAAPFFLHKIKWNMMSIAEILIIFQLS